MITCSYTTAVRYATGLLEGREETLNCITLWVGRVEKTLKTAVIGLHYVQDVTLVYMIGSQNMESYRKGQYSLRRLRQMVKLIWKN